MGKCFSLLLAFGSGGEGEGTRSAKRTWQKSSLVSRGENTLKGDELCVPFCLDRNRKKMCTSSLFLVMVVRLSLEEYNQQAQPTTPFSIELLLLPPPPPDTRRGKTSPHILPKGGGEEPNRGRGEESPAAEKEVCFSFPRFEILGPRFRARSALLGDAKRLCLYVQTPDNIFYSKEKATFLYRYLRQCGKTIKYAKVSSFPPTHTTAGYVRISKFSEDAWSPNLESCRLRESGHRG